MKKYFIFFFTIVLVACNPNRFAVSEIDTTDWKPLLAVPLFTAELKVTDLLRQINNSSVIKVNQDDGFMTLVMESGTYSFQANSLFPFSNIEKRISLVMPFTNFPSSGKIEVSQQINIPIIQSSDKIYSVLLKQGDLIVEPAFSSLNGNVEISSPTISNNGSALLVSSSLSNPISKSLAGYKVELNSNNEFTINVKLTLIGTPGASIGTSTKDFVVKLNSIKSKLIKCFISPKTVDNLTDTLNFEMFELGNLKGGIDFLDPIIRFRSQNSFGGNVKFIIDEMGGVNLDGQVSKVKFSAGQNELIVNKANFVGDIVFDEQELNVSKSLEDVLRTSPNKIYYQNQIVLNGGALPTDTNFVLDTSTVRIKGELELPLQLRFPVLDFSFDRPIDLSDLTIEEIEFIKFKMEFFNKFPLELRFQCLFLDENDVVFDSLLEHGSQLFNSEDLDSRGRINEVSVQKVEIVMDQNRAASLQKAKKVRIKFGFNTANRGEEWVRFYDDYRLGIKCKVLTKASMAAW